MMEIDPESLDAMTEGCDQATREAFRAAVLWLGRSDPGTFPRELAIVVTIFSRALTAHPVKLRAKLASMVETLRETILAHAEANHRVAESVKADADRLQAAVERSVNVQDAHAHSLEQSILKIATSLNMMNVTMKLEARRFAGLKATVVYGAFGVGIGAGLLLPGVAAVVRHAFFIS